MSTKLLKSLMVTLSTLSDENIDKVKEFVETPIKSTPVLNLILPTEMTLGKRTYKILGFLEGDETYVSGETMVNRAKKMNANLGQKDCEFILEHQGDIPAQLRGKIVFVFPNKRHLRYSEDVAYVYWYGGYWVQGWGWLGYAWLGDGRFLRRK